jgi:hypothetical protein
LTVSAAVAVPPPAAAEMVADEDAVTVAAVAVNTALLAPAATTTLAGTVATRVLLLVRVTFLPPLGAGPFSVTVPTDVVPLVTVLGSKVSPLTAGAVTARVADRVTPAPLTEIDDDVLAATGKLVTAKVVVVEPAGTTTEAGTVATAVRLLARVTV